MILVNLYGAPSAGKSSGAAYIFSKLKMAGINAELVTEFAKDKVWEESKEVFNNQAYIFGKQFFRITRVEHKVDVVVTDSPLLLSAYYNTDDYRLGEDFENLVVNVANSFYSMNFFLNRVKSYNPVGRFQTEEESNKVAIELLDFLKEKEVIYEEINGNEKGYDYIVEKILIQLEKEKKAKEKFRKTMGIIIDNPLQEKMLDTFFKKDEGSKIF